MGSLYSIYIHLHCRIILVFHVLSLASSNIYCVAYPVHEWQKVATAYLKILCIISSLFSFSCTDR